MKIKKTFLFLLVISIAIIAIACKINQNSSFELYRFIDHLDKSTIQESPMKNLLHQFPVIRQDLTGKWKQIKELSSRENNVWAVSTDYEVLGEDESTVPEEMHVTRNGLELAYLENMNKIKPGWHWVDGSEKIDLHTYKGFDGSKQGIIIPAGQSFEIEKVFPEDTVMMDLYIEQKNISGSVPHLMVSFNNNYVQEILVNKNFFRIYATLPLGSYKIKFQFKANAQNKSDVLILGMVRVNSHKDVILLVEKSRELAVPQGHYLAVFHTYDVGVMGDTPARQSHILLYDAAHHHLNFESSMNDIATPMKQKVMIGNTTYSAILSPPATRLAFPLRLPKSCILEFSYGFLPESPLQKNHDIHFLITAEFSGKTITLFKKSANSFINDKLSLEQINLSAYEGKKVTFNFITENSSSAEANTVLPIWINPLLYQASAVKNPNIILISIDTLRPDHLGIYGYSRNTSPHIDSLARDGVLFRNALSTTSWTLPAHVSMLTALYSTHHKVYYPLELFSPSIPTLAESLRSHYYYGAAFTGGAYLSAKFGFSKGFDTYEEFKRSTETSLQKNEAALMFQKASQWLDGNKNKKFFLFIHTYQTHSPYGSDAPFGQQFLSKHDKWQDFSPEDTFGDSFTTRVTDDEKANIVNLYDGDIRYTDEALVKPLIEKLRTLDLYDSTLIILTSDHGEEFYEHGAWLHGHDLYNEVTRIPLIMKFPGSAYKNAQIIPTVRIIDIMPSILAYFDIDYTAFNLDGKDFLSVIRGTVTTNRETISDLALKNELNVCPAIISVNHNNLKLIINKKIDPLSPNQPEDLNRYKLELYDIIRDPGEKFNLAYRPWYSSTIKMLIATADTYSKNIQNQQSQEIQLDEELKERLKALGYIK